MSITFDEVETLCARIADQRAVVEKASAAKKVEDKILEELELQLMEKLKQLDRKNFQSKLGTFSISHRVSVKVPSTPEEKAAFFDYLRQKGVFEQMVGVHSQTLNSFYKAEFEAAKDRGEGLDFSIPGLQPPTVMETLSFRAAKQEAKE